MGLRQNEQEKDAELATLNKTNKLLQTKNDQLNQNWRNEQMKVDMLLQTLSKTIHPAKNVSFPLQVQMFFFINIRNQNQIQMSNQKV